MFSNETMPETLEYYKVSNPFWSVVGEYIGEGYDGYYEEGDPEDKPLMRYDFFFHSPDAELPYGVEPGEAVDSYCTSIPITNPKAVIGMGLLFLNALGDLRGYPKRYMQHLTWTTPEEAVEFFDQMYTAEKFSELQITEY